MTTQTATHRSGSPDLRLVVAGGSTWAAGAAEADLARRVRALVRLLSLESRAVRALPGPGAFGPHHWQVTLWRPNARTMTVPFHQGPGHTSAPSTCDVVTALCAESATIDRAGGDLEAWLELYGFDRDATSAAAFDQMLAQRRDLADLLGEAYRDLVHGRARSRGHLTLV